MPWLKTDPQEIALRIPDLHKSRIHQSAVDIRLGKPVGEVRPPETTLADVEVPDGMK